jgi:hypothetical protein
MSRGLNDALVAIAAMLTASSALAHHSHAMFDSDKRVTLVGTVKEFEWNNPHCWIQLFVPDPNDPKAPPLEWSVEMGAPIQLLRHGWKLGTLKAGDKITVVVKHLWGSSLALLSVCWSWSSWALGL